MDERLYSSEFNWKPRGVIHHPRDRAEGARFSYYRTNGPQLWNEWPTAIIDVLRSNKPTNTQRATLFGFLVGNGLSPTEARDVIADTPTWRLDAEAIRQLAWLQQYWFTYAKQKKWEYWNLQTRDTDYFT